MVTFPSRFASAPTQVAAPAWPRAMFAIVKSSSTVTEPSLLQSPVQGRGVAVGLAVGEAVQVAVRLPVGAGVFISVGVELAVTVGVALGVTVGGGVAVSVGV